MQKIGFFSLFLISLSFADAPVTISPVTASSSPLPLSELFSIAKNPGGGQWVFSRGGKTEPIPLGTTDGFYAMGLAFTRGTLPDSFSGEVVQLVLGRLPQEGKSQPQFATATMLFDQPLTQMRSLEFSVPSPKNKAHNSALLLFMPPSVSGEASDEEKLKNTYFAHAGNVTAIPKGKPTTISVNHQGNKLKFRLQALALEIEAKLGTPFNAQEANIKGVIEVPCYWPSGRPAQELLRDLAHTSLGSLANPTPERDVSSTPPSPKKD